VEVASRRVLIGFMAVFLILEAWVGYWTVVRGPALEAHARNPRRIEAESRVARGGINDRHGQSLAASVWERNSYKRHFLGPLSLSQTIGYLHPRFGKSGLERTFDADLRGGAVTRGGLFTYRNAPREGLELTTTIDTQVQKVAEKALAGRKGAVVALDANTGAILAAASVPFFDPNNISEDLFSGSAGGPLFNRALQGRYPPGSSWKPLILAAALETKAVSVKDVFEDRKSITVEGYEIRNYEEKERGRLGLTDALAYSSNVVFVQIGLKTGGRAIAQLAQQMGLFNAPKLGTPAAASHLPSQDSLQQRSVVAEVSIGQGEAWVSPLHMAVLAATIGNGGYAITPYLVQSVGNRDVAPVVPRKRVLSEETATFVADAMRAVVTRGTGTRAAVSGVEVAGKTGTADNPVGRAHAWFIGFAPYSGGVVAVAVVIENAGGGGTQAAPVAAQVIEATVRSPVGRRREEAAVQSRKAVYL
jgi:peptidoglycan glycosyltransferase